MPNLTPQPDGREVYIAISNRTVVRVLILVVVTILSLAILRQAAHSLVLLFTAFFLAVSLNAPVHWLSQHLPGRTKGNRSLATILSVLVVLALLAGFLAIVIPPIVKQSTTLIDAVPTFVNNLRDKNSDIGQLVAHYHLQSQISSLSSEVSSHARSAGQVAANTIADVGSSLISLLTVLVLTFMMLVEGPRWVNLAQRLAPQKSRRRFIKLGIAMYNVVKGYVNGQVLLAAIASGLVLIGLLLFHVDYPFALMAVVFICGLIPLVGHTIGAVVVFLVALLHSPFAAGGILLYYISYQQVENYLVQPRIQASSTNMSPLLVFVAVVLGAGLGGLFGALVAIPIMGCLRIIVLDQLTARNILTDNETKAELAKAETK